MADLSIRQVLDQVYGGRERVLCPSSTFADDYDAFKQGRSELLTQAALALVGPRTLTSSN